jgi:hypothetical protein
MTPTATFNLLHEILDELKAIRASLSTHKQPCSDRDVLARLLPAIAGKLGSEGFQVRDVMRNEIFRQLIGNRNAHQLGNLLAKWQGQNIGGLIVERLTTEHGVAVWRVTR